MVCCYSSKLLLLCAGWCWLNSGLDCQMKVGSPCGNIIFFIVPPIEKLLFLQETVWHWKPQLYLHSGECRHFIFNCENMFFQIQFACVHACISTDHFNKQNHVFVHRWRVKVHIRPWASLICCLTTSRPIWLLNGKDTEWPLFKDLLTLTIHLRKKKTQPWPLHSFAMNPLFSVVVLPHVVACWTDVLVILRLLVLSWGQVSVLRPYWVLHMKLQLKLSLMKLWYLLYILYHI